jgi:OOP family OmpA-OmpF porin
MTLRFRALATIGAIAFLAPMPAGAQRSQRDNPSMQELIDHLQPGTRGIRVPSQEPAAAPAAPAPSRIAATTALSGTPAVSLSVRFANGSAALTPAVERSLDDLGRALSSPQLAPYRFRIEGHTDTVGSTELNQALSERRAAAVRDYLTGKYSISPARLEAVGLGKSQLLLPTPDETPEPRNRRVQVVNLGG